MENVERCQPLPANEIVAAHRPLGEVEGRSKGLKHVSLWV
jgi:hypothetical protein